jgi:hypothetical protein
VGVLILPLPLGVIRVVVLVVLYLLVVLLETNQEQMMVVVKEVKVAMERLMEKAAEVVQEAIRVLVIQLKKVVIQVIEIQLTLTLAGLFILLGKRVLLVLEKAAAVAAVQVELIQVLVLAVV